jgi:hypothetical protein
MIGRAGVLARVTIFRVIATSDMTAGAAQA